MKQESVSSWWFAIQQVIQNTKKLLRLSWNMDKRLTALYYFTAGIGAMTPVAISYFLKLLIDYLQSAQQISATVPLIVIIVLAARYAAGLFEDLVYWTFNQSYLDYLFRYKLQNEISLRFHKKVSLLDIAHFENPQTQDLITTVRDTMLWRVADFVRIFSYWLRDVVAYVAAFIVLLPFGWWIPTIVTIVTIPRLYLKAKYGSLLWSIWGSGAAQGRKLWYFNYLLQDPTAVREMRIFQSTNALLKKFQDTAEQLYRLHKKPLDMYLKISTFPVLLEISIILVFSYMFLPQVVSGALTIGTFTLLISMLEQLSDRSANASAKIGELYENNLFVNDYFRLLSLPKLVVESDNPVIFDGVKPPRIEFKNVSFQYENGPAVLENVSFIIEPGENIAFVGHNGAGKTTIVKLLCRFYDVTEGEILI
ncbi:ABC transporter ATP-binding protein, partial [Candidatus Roizmanbacteria bacterium]|nr:ABC transporter ATP-binding protein [Candidatus Roizmanbacteria bacterium]